MFDISNPVHIPLVFQQTFPSRGVFYKERHPDFLLSSYIAYYWMLRFEDRDYPVKTTPSDGGSDIIIDMDNLSTPMFFGQSSSSFSVPRSRRQNIFGIRLKPGAAYNLFSIPAIDFFDSVIPLSLLASKDKMGEYSEALDFDAIEEDSSFRMMVQTCERWAFSLIDKISMDDRRSTKLLNLCDNIHLYTSVDKIVRQLGLSSRQVERLFKTVLGLTPKSFVRINRFQGVLAGKNFNNDISWSEMSQIHGYYDQSHLCRDFKEFTGMAPDEYFNHHLLST